MKVEIVSTGTELLLGEIINSNFQYLAERLNALGFDVIYETTVGDNWQRMKEVIAKAKERADLVITIGGLGPTLGDITKEVTAEVLNKPLILDKKSEDKIKCFFQRRNVPMPENNIKQAMLPDGALVLENRRGTAPGVFAEHAAGAIVNLPGPSQELIDMFEQSLVPLLFEKYGSQGVIFSRTLRLVGIGESSVAEILHDLIKNQSNPTIALYARQGELIVRLTAKAQNNEQALALISGLEKQIRGRLPMIYGSDGETLPILVAQLLKTRKLTMSIAESCTGGLIGSMITDLPGSSAYFPGAVTCYGNSAKVSMTGASADTIAEYGAVSGQVAEEMAKGVALRFSADIGLGVTGIAGPDGGSEEKPVGTVYISVFFRGEFTTNKYLFAGDRLNVKTRTAKMALFNVLSVLRKNLEE